MQTDCVIFSGCILNSGYGQLRRQGRRWLAHRWAWTQVNGPIPDGMVIRHTCDNPSCVNADHLVIGTQSQNMADMVERGRHPGTHRRPVTPDHCVNGHEFTPENTRRYKGKRVCRACFRERLALNATQVRDAIYASRQGL